MTKKKIFNTVKNHLLKQKEKSYFEGLDGGKSCAYYGDNGKKCAVGCLIKPEFYDIDMEDKDIGSIVIRQALIESGVPVNSKDSVNIIDMLSSLQELHDGIPVKYWKEKLNELAVEYKI